MAYVKFFRILRGWLPRFLPCLLFLWVGVAHAGEPPRGPKQEAKAHFLAGQSHYNLGELAEAITEFKEAYRLYPDPAFLYNLGQCARQMGRAEEAIRFYRNYLREAPGAPNQPEVEQRIAELEAQRAKSAPTEPSPPVPAPAPAPAPEGAAAPAATVASTAGPPPDPAGTPPVYKRWWFWTAAVVVVVGVGVGLYAANAGGASAPHTALGAQAVF
jgi:tetratricopeptide (TPR) repeat protein